LGWILPSVGCQVEYAGMTLPSGRYMHDDVQYFPSGPDFPWANTQAAAQRARMRAMGIEPPPPVGTAPVAPGALERVQMPGAGAGINPNVQPMPPAPGQPVPPQPMPPGAGALPAPAPQPPGGVPAPAPGGGQAPPAANPPGDNS
jgi:hypothetical protein